MSYVGVNIGALSVKVVSLDGGPWATLILAHRGRPVDVVKDALARPEFAGADYVGVSGHLGHISPAIYGEVIPTVGKALGAEREGYDGVLLIGPFNCLPFRISESILKPVCQGRGLPILTYESDGYAVAPSFLRQVEVHIQQVLERHRMRSAEPAGLVPVGVTGGGEKHWSFH